MSVAATKKGSIMRLKLTPELRIAISSVRAAKRVVTSTVAINDVMGVRRAAK